MYHIGAEIYFDAVIQFNKFNKNLLSSRHFQIPPLDMFCIPCFSPLSIWRVSQYSTIESILMPLTEPCLQFSHTRLFGNAPCKP